MVFVPDITTDEACRQALIDSQIDICLEVALVNETPADHDHHARR